MVYSLFHGHSITLTLLRLQLTAASRQTFAFSRDGGLPLSRFIYSINTLTQSPVNAVWFTAFMAHLLALLAFAGAAAIGAIFSLVVVGQYVAYCIPISARFLGGQPFKPGPFSLGKFVRTSRFLHYLPIAFLCIFQSLPVAIIAVSWMTFMSIVFLFPTAPAPVAFSMNYTVVVLGGVLALSVIYFYFPKYGGVYWFKGPVANVGYVDDQSDEGEGSLHKQPVSKEAL